LFHRDRSCYSEADQRGDASGRAYKRRSEKPSPGEQLSILFVQASIYSYYFFLMAISSYVSCLETNSIISCSYSEIPAAQQKIARRGSGEPVDSAGGWPLGFSGAKQLTVRVSSGPPSVLWVRGGRLCSHRRRRQQQQQRRR
jgi:hypothetical protein